jgi:hypothetical protein
MTTTIHIDLDEPKYRRLHAIAGRRQRQPDDLVREMIVKLIEADLPGRINPVLRAINPSARLCHYCGTALPPTATRRRKYCGAKCRVAGNRAAASKP